jgi:hypothetical protein
MNNKKEKLINGLRLSISALTNDTIIYDWHQQESCNCGVVAQAITGIKRDKLKLKFSEQISEKLNDIKYKDDKKVQLTWRNAVKYLCPITGLSNIEILDRLHGAGLSKEDMVHLEYMNNPAILAKSGIETTTKVERQEEYTKEIIQKTKEVPHPKFWPRLLGHKVTEQYSEEIKGYRTVNEEVKINDYYKSKENLIKYLKAWLSIILDGSQKKSIKSYTTEELEAEILVAVAEENYEGAALLRDRLTEFS